MRCGTSERLMSLALDDRATAAERSQLEAHLATCARCREQHAVLVRSTAALRSVGRAEPPAGLAKRAVRAALAAPVPARSGLLDLLAFFRWPALATATASAVLAVVLATSAPRSAAPDPSAGASLAFLEGTADVGLDLDVAMASVLAAEEE
jgi:anti-sigma factor RsiW